MFLHRLLCLWITVSFVSTLIVPPQRLYAQTVLDLPAPGTMVSTSPAFEPALIKGLTVHKDNPFLFDFIVDPGQSKYPKQVLKDESLRMIKYFFAALTIPDKDVWVNLSPYEKDRMVPVSLGQTAMGRDLLAQDYLLKQLTASLIYPQKALGKTFWNEVYTKAKAMYGTTQIPVNTFNKVWIVPQRAGVYEHGQTAFIVNGHLKVMLEEDYEALNKNIKSAESRGLAKGFNDRGISGFKSSAIGTQVLREIVIPALETEINEGKNFATLRQIFYAQVLAVWFKRNLKQALLNRVYANKGTVKGIDQNDAATNEAIYHQYLRAYKKGVFNFIKEDIDPVTQETLPRKYFSGGYAAGVDIKIDSAQLSPIDMATISKRDVAVSVFAAALALRLGTGHADSEISFQPEKYGVMIGQHKNRLVFPNNFAFEEGKFYQFVKPNPDPDWDLPYRMIFRVDTVGEKGFHDYRVTITTDNGDIVGLPLGGGYSGQYVEVQAPAQFPSYQSLPRAANPPSEKPSPRNVAVNYILSGEEADRVMDFLQPLLPYIRSNSQFRSMRIRRMKDGDNTRELMLGSDAILYTYSAFEYVGPPEWKKTKRKYGHFGEFVGYVGNKKAEGRPVVVGVIIKYGNTIYYIDRNGAAIPISRENYHFIEYKDNEAMLSSSARNDAAMTPAYWELSDYGKLNYLREVLRSRRIHRVGTVEGINKLKEAIHRLENQIEGERIRSLEWYYNPWNQYRRYYAADRASIAKPPGGIDLSQQDAALRVTKDANGGVKVNVDPALIARVEREGMPEVVPVIINMQPADIWSLFGAGV